MQLKMFHSHRFATQMKRKRRWYVRWLIKLNPSDKKFFFFFLKLEPKGTVGLSKHKGFRLKPLICVSFLTIHIRIYTIFLVQIAVLVFAIIVVVVAGIMIGRYAVPANKASASTSADIWYCERHVSCPRT